MTDKHNDNAVLRACSARLMLLDKDGIVRLVNPALLAFFEQVNARHPDQPLPCSEDDLIGQPLARCIPLDINPSLLRDCAPDQRLRTADTQLGIGAVANPVSDDDEIACVLTWQALGGQQQLIAALSETREALAAGRLETRLDASERALPSKLVAGINGCLQSTQDSLQELEHAVAGMAQCDLSEPIPEYFDGAVGHIYARLGSGLSNLAEAIRQTLVAADAIAETSTGISAQNRQLAERTREQARAIELTGQNMEELSGTVQGNADHAREAERFAREANALAETGRESVLKVVDSMNAINDSSSQITGIIAMINEIAFQTNILSLNAAVEAARAGEHGRGFGVVASEVRTLAQRSAAAANEIKGLIESSRQINARGHQLADEAEHKMGEVVSGVQEVNRRIGEISSATEEQAIGIRHANDAIGQIDIITQQNHALVEKLADNAGELDTQVAFLHAAAKVFKLPEGEFTHPQHARSCQLAQAAAEQIGATFEAALGTGRMSENDLYDSDYQPIANTDPQKFSTRFDGFTDRDISPIQERVLAEHPELIYAISADGNGYVPTHNLCFSKPLTGDYQTDFAGNRGKRIFDDPVGSQVGRHTEPYKLQTYRRDTGELMFDLSVPIYVNGRHWGGFRVGYRIE